MSTKPLLREGSEETISGDFAQVSDYAAIGDCRTIALISKEGSVDWLCLPYPSAPSFFGALLDRHRGGRLAVVPRDVLRVERRYVERTNVLQTTFHCRSGSLCVTDFITIDVPTKRHATLRPQHELIRLLECIEGEVEVDIIYQPRPGYARRLPRLVKRGRLGWMCACDGLGAFLQSDMELSLHDEATLRGHLHLHSGDFRQLVFTACENDVAVLLPLGEEPRQRLATTARWWQDWSAQCVYEGAYKDQIIRSCLALKLLTFSLSGAVLAAATTSLSVAETGERNWDYRYCWLRDSSLVLQAFLGLGFREESRAFLGWLLHATALTQPRLQVMYDVYGRTGIAERELRHLRGHNGLGPVRIGNGAHAQLQLDVYGEVVRAAALFVEAGGVLDRTERTLLAGFGATVCKLWRRADQSIWEVRSAPRHYTYSKMMCWVALDQLIRMHSTTPFDVKIDAWIRERTCIREDIEAHAYDRELNSYVAYYGGQMPDASLLLLARYGYIDPNDPHMIGTCRYIEQHLGADGLLYRYVPNSNSDGVPGKENFFALCSFWLVDYLARAGERSRATELFDRLTALANDVGLYAEEFATTDLSLCGNFPQAFTHLGLITAAQTLTSMRADGGRVGS